MSALFTVAARGVQPRHPDPGSRLWPLDSFTNLFDYARDLMTGHDGEVGEREGSLQQA
jgi:hypothetical protein